MTKSPASPWIAAAWALSAFFLLMVGYYCLRPIREAFGVERGKEALKYLYLGTFAGTLVAAPLYARLVGAMNRRRFMPLVFRVLSLNLLGFVACAIWLKDSPWPGRIFYCWLSVYSLFAVSVIWSFFLDVFSEQEAKRLFGPITVGMSAGGIVGSLVASHAISTFGLIGVLLIPVVIAEVLIFALRQVEKYGNSSLDDAVEREDPVPGSVVHGLQVVRESRYLTMICALLFCIASVSTVFYFAQNNYVRAAFGSDFEAKTRFFANMNLWTQCITIGCQAFLVTVMVRKLGMTTALTVLPVIAVITLIALGSQGGLAVLMPCFILMKGVQRGINSPTKQMLFSVVDREQKYKSKNFIDTAVVRGSDVVAMWILALMQEFLGLSVETIVLLSVVIAVGWFVVARVIGRLHDKALA